MTHPNLEEIIPTPAPIASIPLRTQARSLSGSGSGTPTPKPSVEIKKQPTSTSTDITPGAIIRPTPGRTLTSSSSWPNPPDQVYNRFSPGRKAAITAVCSFCGFLAQASSTAILAAIPEVADTFRTGGPIIDLSNAFFMLFMGLSPLFWGPYGQIYGRRCASLTSAILFTIFSAGSALSPDLVSFFACRILTAIQGTAFLVIGSACIGDIYHPTERGTALAWFLSGTLAGPAFGPFLGGILVTHASWRHILWMQTGLGGVGVLGIAFLLPETTHYRRCVELKGLKRREKAGRLWAWMNPTRVVRLYRYPNLMAAGVASASLIWNMYSLLTPIRYVLNPRFHLTSPAQVGLFYLAPGFGYVLGTFGGGRWADRTVRVWIKKRGGQRVPEDRLRSSLPFMGIVIPACIVVYGWTIEKRVGGIALPVIVMFIQGVAQLFCFPSLNTYCLDVFQSRSAEVVAGNYVARYLAAALASAVCLPAIDRVGIGAYSTLSAAFLMAAAALIWLTAEFGEDWRNKVDEKRRTRRDGARGAVVLVSSKDNAELV
ncbi:major facilitator superfamily domain-containing protein [Phyllosticta citribraziliensis]|uniref:Major facilitator superfamily domain-containing protein n=1 Tax=Phyllosticta citribraziliensis TaxID=989973 RepID=A0ABR1LJC4_9PEZI